MILRSVLQHLTQKYFNNTKNIFSMLIKMSYANCKQKLWKNRKKPEKIDKFWNIKSNNWKKKIIESKKYLIICKSKYEDA